MLIDNTNNMSKYEVRISVNGLERVYQGEFHEVYNRNWNERVHDALEAILEFEEERNRDHAYDNQA